MGDPRRLKKKFKKPRNPFERERILEELQFIGKYGLRNKREFWKMRTIVGNWRDLARKSRSLPSDQMVEVQQTLIKKLVKLGILGQEADFDDVLLIGVEDLLKRRLQSLVFEKGFAQTIYQARQLVVHRHIQINGKIINAPSYIVKKAQEDFIGLTATSPLSTAKQTN
jgi:small subunit ribosomal protein S4